MQPCSIGLCSTITRAARVQDDLLTDEELRAAMVPYRVPGASLTVMDDNRVAWTRTWGLRALVTGEPVDAETRFQTCSMTKTVNGLLFMILAHEGKIDLDAAANLYLDKWKLQGPDADRVTIAMLLTHTGGTSVYGYWGYTPGVPIPTVEQILDGASPANSLPVRVVRPPGAEFSYSSGGTTVLQKLAQDVTGRNYADLVNELIVEPLGMRHSVMGMPPPREITNLALGHRDGVTVRGGYCIQPELASVGLWSTGTDYALFLAALIDAVRGQARSIISQQLALRMITPPSGDMGLGCFSQSPGIFNHAGGGVGYRTHYVADASSGRAVITLSNAEEGAPPLRALRQIVCDRLGWFLPGDPPA
jgi:CubicO group peptidase (beta-lactamase class C family)